MRCGRPDAFSASSKGLKALVHSLASLRCAGGPPKGGPPRLSKKWLNATFSSFYGFHLSHSLPGGETRKVRKPPGFHPF